MLNNLYNTFPHLVNAGFISFIFTIETLLFILLAQFKSTFKPTDFWGLPYEFGSNQKAHAMLGLLFLHLFCRIFFEVTNDYPFKETLLLTLWGSYIYYEFVRQGWHGLDTIADVYFVCAPASGFILIFDHVEKGQSTIIGDQSQFDLIIVLFLTGLALGVARRIKQAGGKFNG